MAGNSIFSGRIWLKFKLIQAFMHVLVSYKNEKVPRKMKALEWSQQFSHCKSMVIFFKRSRAANSAVHNWIWPNFELIREFMVVLVTCKNEKDPIKSECARVFTTLYIIFSDTQEQLTTHSVLISDRNLNSSKLLCLFSSPARMKMIQLKMKGLEWSQRSRAANFEVLGPIWPNFEFVLDVIDVLRSLPRSSFKQTMMGWIPQCYIPSFVEIGPPVPEKKYFDRFLPYRGVAAILVM